MDKTKKGTDASQKQFVSRAFDLIRDCSDNYHTCFQGETQSQAFGGCSSFSTRYFNSCRIICNLEFVSGKSKSSTLMQCHKNFLNTQDLRYSAVNHGSEHKPSAPPPLVITLVGQVGACHPKTSSGWATGSHLIHQPPLLLSHNTSEA